MLVKEFIQVLRNPRMKVTILVVPVIQLVVFGYAATTDVRNAARRRWSRARFVTSARKSTRSRPW